mgnify:CR=1 FL=1
MPRSTRLLIPLVLVTTGLSACADRPDLSGWTSPLPVSSDWPTLLPSDKLDTMTSVSHADPAATTDALAARAAALRARAARLAAQPVLSTAERARLAAAVN